MQLLCHSFPSSMLKSVYKNCTLFILFGSFPKQRLLLTLCAHLSLSSPEFSCYLSLLVVILLTINIAYMILYLLLSRRARVPTGYSFPHQALHLRCISSVLGCPLNSIQVILQVISHLLPSWYPVCPWQLLSQHRPHPQTAVIPSIAVLLQQIHTFGSVFRTNTAFQLLAMNFAHRHSRQLKGLWLSSVSLCSVQFLFSSFSFARDTFSRNKHFFPCQFQITSLGALQHLTLPTFLKENHSIHLWRERSIAQECRTGLDTWHLFLALLLDGHIIPGDHFTLLCFHLCNTSGNTSI